MNQLNRGTFVLAIFLIALGVILLLLNMFSSWSLNVSWPIIFLVFAAGFFIPPVVFPRLRMGLAALFIPGSLMAVMGLVFIYNVLTDDWLSWSYAWLLLSAGTGAGLALSGWYGSWGKTVTLVGFWIMVASSVLFAFFGFIFGTTIMKTMTAGVLILIGIILVLRALVKHSPTSSDRIL